MAQPWHVHTTQTLRRTVSLARLQAITSHHAPALRTTPTSSASGQHVVAASMAKHNCALQAREECALRPRIARAASDKWVCRRDSATHALCQSLYEIHPLLGVTQDEPHASPCGLMRAEYMLCVQWGFLGPSRAHDMPNGCIQSSWTLAPAACCCCLQPPAHTRHAF